MTKFNSIDDFLSFVYSQKRFTKKRSLDRMKYFSALFNNPHESFKTIHVAGTNGKGSTVAFMKSILRTNGLNVATYTSPFITKFNERIMYNEQMISDAEILEIGNEIISKYDIMINDNVETPSFFEFITLLAYIYYSRLENLDVAIIEVGIGGRLDSTNIIDPVVSVITSISYDHENVLGNTKSMIAYEKAGIIKKNSGVVVPYISDEINKIFNAQAKFIDSQIIKIDPKDIQIIKTDVNHSIYNYKNMNNILINLPGFHQIGNSILAIETIKYFIRKSKISITDESLYEGLKNTKWLGRLEIVNQKPLIILDGAHNEDGITKICEYVDSTILVKKRCVFAVSSNKNKIKMIEKIDNTFDEIIFTEFNYKRSDEATNIFNISSSQNKSINYDIDSIIEIAKKDQSYTTIFIGSLYFISEIRPKFKS